MNIETGMAEGEDRLLGDMLEVIRFTEGVSVKLHRVLDEAKIYQVVREEFSKSDRYTVGILLLDEDGTNLNIAGTSLPPSRLKVLEEASGLRLKEFKISLIKSSIYRQVVREGKTLHANISDILREFLPRPMAYLISKTMGYDKQTSIMTPLHRHGKVIGVLAMSCTDLCEYLIHSVENLALHISTALELADEHNQRKEAVEALKRYHDHLGELVEERTAELKALNEKLLEEITERKQAGEALREERDKAQKYLDIAGVMLVAIDVNQKVTLINKRGCEVLGYREEEVIGKNWFDIFLPKRVRNEVKAVFDKLMAGEIKPSEYFENPILTKGGEERIIAWHNIILAGEGDKIGGTLSSGEDITERKQAAEALRESREKFQKMFESVTDGISVVDLNGVIIETNPRTVEMHGYKSKDELLGKSALELVAPRDRERIAQNMRRAIKEGTIRGAEYTLLKADGTEFPGELSTSILKDAAGNWVGHITISRNITKRKQAEEALQTEKNKLQSLLDAMEDGLTIQDKDYNIIYQNEPSRISSGGDHLGEKCYRAYEGGEEICEGCPVARAFKDGKSHTAERKTVAPSGEVIFWENTANPIRDAKGRIVACLEIGRSITERKQAEEALRESREKFQKMFESVTDGISVVDLNGVIIETNPRTVEMHGYKSKDELLGKSALELVAPRDHERIAQNMRRAIKEGTISGVEYTLLKADGTEFPGELSTSVIRDASGRVVAHITIARDITKRKQAAEALRESEERFRSIVENSQAGIMIMDDAYRFLYVNDELCRISGYSPDELIGQDFRQFLDEESKGLVAERYIRRQRGEGVPPRYEFNIVRKDGQKKCVELSSAVIKDSAGEVKTVAQLLDITERKQAEEQLRESQKFSSSLLAGSPNPITVVNPDTSIRYANPAFESLTGFIFAEIAGRKAPYPWWPEGKRERILASFKDAIEHGGRRTERNFRKKNGESFWVAVNSAPVMQEGKAVYLIISWLDITERKQAEEKEKHLQQELYLAQRLASVGELAAGVAHEINNPLTGVLGSSQQLMRKSRDAKVSRGLEIIHSEAQRAAEVVQNLLTFARRRQPKKEYVNINDVVNKTLELRAYALQTDNIEVVTTLARRLPQIMADFPQMQEVFLSIILNAEQAMSEAHGKGKLTIKTRRIKDYVRISFADDGPGISPENLDKVFDPFFTTRGKRGGSGLGLSACHGIVTKHGGRIYARSKGGKGATLFVELPLSPAENTAGRGV